MVLPNAFKYNKAILTHFNFKHYRLHVSKEKTA